MELEQKLKLLAEQNIFGINKLIKLGGSYALILPRTWVDIHCISIDDAFYVKLQVIDGKLVFSSIAPRDIADIVIKEKK